MGNLSLGADQVKNATFSMKMFRGYDLAATDKLLASVEDALRKYETGEEGRRITSQKLRRTTLPKAFPGGYARDEVDALLRKAEVTLEWYEQA